MKYANGWFLAGVILAAGCSSKKPDPAAASATASTPATAAASAAASVATSAAKPASVERGTVSKPKKLSDALAGLKLTPPPAGSAAPAGGSPAPAPTAPPPPPADWVRMVDAVKGFAFYLPVNAAGHAESKDGVDLFLAQVPEPYVVTVACLSFKDRARSKDDLRGEAKALLELLGEKNVNFEQTQTLTDDYDISAVSSEASDGSGKSKMIVLVATDVTDNYVLVVHSPESKWAQNEATVNQIWGSFEMFSGGGKGRVDYGSYQPLPTANLKSCHPDEARIYGNVCVGLCGPGEMCQAGTSCNYVPSINDQGQIGPSVAVCVNSGQWGGDEPSAPTSGGGAACNVMSQDCPSGFKCVSDGVSRSGGTCQPGQGSGQETPQGGDAGDACNPMDASSCRPGLQCVTQGGRSGICGMPINAGEGDDDEG